jgi:Fe-S cluster assembly iron-binding protein IscA
MLEISPSAAALIREMIDDVSGIEGIRVAQAPSESQNGSAPQVAIAITPAPGPLDEDQTLMEDGINVFVDPDIAPLLDDKLLDLVSAGEDEVQFTLTEQL